MEKKRRVIGDGEERKSRERKGRRRVMLLLSRFK